MTLGDRVMAAWKAFRDYDDSRQPDLAYEGRYALLWSFYNGVWVADPSIRREGPEVYENSRQVFKNTSAIVAIYNQFVYAGDLSTDGRLLPDGSRGAIPIDPQTEEKADGDRMLAAYHQLFALWQWRQFMSLRPKLGAILGSVLTELVDDPAAGMVVPNVVWPGYVPLRDLELDYTGNVKAYALEYQVHVEPREAYGRRVEAEDYLYRKEVTPEEFRYYKNGRPWDYPEHGPAVQPNPYGFCPAVWDRHEITFGELGTSAIEKSLNQSMQINSVLSQALDYQARLLAAPVGVKGAAVGTRARRVTLPKQVQASLIGQKFTDEEAAEARRAAAEDWNLLPMSDQGEFVRVDMDLGDTKQLIDTLIESAMRENPEAEYGSKLLDLKTATGPGVDRILAPITGNVRDARKNYDPQTVKLLQMGTSMMAFNLSRVGVFWPREVVRRREKRYEPFREYTLDSYFEGRLDCSIPERPVFAESQDERIARLVQINSLIADPDPWVLREAGVPEAEVARILKEKEEAREAMDAQLTGVGSLVDDPAQGPVPEDQQVEADPAT